jgi:DNA-directed RNA polymerase specialized sigma subunit
MQSNISKEDVIFFLDMVNSNRSPNFNGQFRVKKPYIALLKERNSTEYKRFVEIYQAIKHILLERERLILDRYYGIHQKTDYLKNIGKEFNIRGERVRQLIAKAENRLANELAKGRILKSYDL